MLKEQAKLVSTINIAIDLITLLCAFLIAYWLRYLQGGLSNVFHYLWILLVILPLWITLLHHFGFYSSKRMASIPRILVDLIKVHAVGGIVTSSIIFLITPRDFSRELLLLTLLFSFLLLTCVQVATRATLKFMRRLGYNYRNIVLVGMQKGAANLIELVEEHEEWGVRILGLIQPQAGEYPEFAHGHLVLGTMDHITDICKKHPVDEVIFCTTKDEFKFDVEEYVNELEEMGVTVRMVLNLYFKFNTRKDLSLFHGELPLMTFYPRTFDAGQLFFKRCLDVAGAYTGLILTGILFPFIALAIKLDSPGPLFFGQTRVRENGRTFRCWKFRSMYIDAEERKKELMALNEMKGAIFKIKDDPRITKVGKFLRKTSLDELPQFWNVLKGEMSLVGTRPPTPDEVEKYENWQRKRICIKPGITGLWQVSGRNQIQDFDDVVRLDLDYIERWSLSLDVYLLFKTIKVVFAREGSC